MAGGIDKGYLALGVGIGTIVVASVFPYGTVAPGTATKGKGNFFAGQELMAGIYMVGGAVTAILALGAEARWLKYLGLVLAMVLVANGIMDLFNEGFL